jgi:DNA-binding LytR/AlgR family response regulator
MSDRTKQARTQDDPGQGHSGVYPSLNVVAETDGGLWPPQITGEKSGHIYFLPAREVEYLASAGNYVVAHVGASEFLTRATLKHMVLRLAPLGFVQIERSLLINLRQIEHVERHERGRFRFVMRSGACLVSSRERGSDIRAMLFGASTPKHP